MKSVNSAMSDQPSKMKWKDYSKELRKLQTELCHLQEWVKKEGLRVIIVFEGRDAAGKGGTIKAITERVSPRVLLSPFRPPRIAKRPSSSCSAISRISRPPARS